MSSATSDSTTLRYQVAQLERLCRAYPAAPKVVFVPSLQVGYNLGTTLANAGISWVNLHLTTTFEWAERSVGARLRARGRRPLVRDAAHFFVLESVKQTAWPENHPFRRGYSAGGLAATFLRTVRALRLGGVEPDEFVKANPSLEGRTFLIDLYRAYGQWLEEEGLYDRADLYREAALSAGGSDQIVAVLDETPLPETAYRFMLSLGEEVMRIGRSDYGRTAPQHSAMERFSGAPIVEEACGSVGPAGRVHLNGVHRRESARIALREAVGVENEVRGALRELLSTGIPLDRVEIAYAAEDPYLPMLVDLMERFDLLAAYASGVPVTLTRVGQALIGFFRWIGEDFDPDVLIRLLRTCLRSARPEDEMNLGGAVVAAALLESRVGPGRHAWRQSLQRAAGRLAEEAEDAPEERQAYFYRKISRIRGVIAWMERLLALIPPGSAAALADVARTGIAFVKQFSQPNDGDRGMRAAESLSDRLHELAEATSVTGELSELAAALAELIADHKVEAAAARPGRAYVVPLERAGYAGREYTVVVGLSEATFPGVSIEDPILLDHERGRLFGGKLALHRERAGEPIWQLIRVLGAASSDVVLVANRRDLTTGRETFPAAVFEDLKQQLGIKHPASFGVVPAPSDVLSSDEAAMALRYRPATASQLLSDRPWLDAGLEAVRARAHPQLGRYDGWVGGPTPDLRPGPHTTVSVSRLEDLAACPYRYFLRNVLKVRPPDRQEDIPGRWLTPLEFGSLLHDVLRAFMEAVTERGERVDAERHAGLMAEVLDHSLSRLRERIPIRFEAGHRADVRRLERAVKIFLSEESRRNVRPLGFEVSFGRGHGDSLASPEPVCIRLTDEVAIKLSGSIDRVDEADGGFEVWDYKSGSGYGFDEADLLSGGRRLQWALYAYVLEELAGRVGRKARTLRSGYFFPSDREHGLRLGAEPPSRKRVGRLLAPLLELVEQGAFLHVQKKNACTYCDYRNICASERKGRDDMAAVLPATESAPFHSALKRWMDA